MFRNIYYLIGQTGKIELLRVVFVSFVVAIFEVGTIASVLPFIGIMSGADQVWSDRLSEYLGVSDPNQLLMYFGFIVGTIFLVATYVKILSQVFIARYINTARHKLAIRLLKIYLSQNYAFFVGRHSSDLKKTMLSEVEIVVGNIVRPMTALVSQSVLFVAIVSVILYVNFVASLIAFAALLTCYLIIFFYTQKSTLLIGKTRETANRARFNIADEIFGGIKDIKALDVESHFINRFSTPSRLVSESMAKNDILSQVPKHIIEGVTFCSLFFGCSITILLNPESAIGNGALPTIGLFGFAGYRLLPVVQALYQSTNQLRFGGASLPGLVADLQRPIDPMRETAHLEPIKELDQPLVLENLSFTHLGADSPSLKELNITLPPVGVIGVAGGSGAGKTTLIDILLGLLVPTNGAMKKGSQTITTTNIESLRSSIGYVPQNPHIFSGTIAENIAVAQDQSTIDMAQVQRVCEVAKIADFILAELPEGYETHVGEKGIKLSGGQRQRISIARALYRQPSIIIFDEATSALDNITERSVIETIEAIEQDVLIIMVAHRLSTLENCDKIVLMDAGRCIAYDSFGNLSKTNDIFRQLQAGSVNTKRMAPA